SPAPPAGAALVILTTRAERRPALPVFAGRSGPGQAVHNPCDPPKVKPRPRKCAPQAKARASFIGSDHTYGARRVWKDLLAERVSCGLHRIERVTARKVYRSRDEAKADVFDYLERFSNTKRRHSTIGYVSPMEFEMQAGFAYPGVIRTGRWGN